jgi:hypothetical protein
MKVKMVGKRNCIDEDVDGGKDGWCVVADRVTRHQVHFPGGLSNWKGDKRKGKRERKRSVYGCM